jgi:hypothetical protein
VEKRRKRKRRESQDGAEAESCATEMMAPDRVQQCSVHAAQSVGLVGAVSARTRAIVGKGCHGARCDACDGGERPWHMASESVWRPRYARNQRAVMRGCDQGHACP